MALIDGERCPFGNALVTTIWQQPSTVTDRGPRMPSDRQCRWSAAEHPSTLAAPRCRCLSTARQRTTSRRCPACFPISRDRFLPAASRCDALGASRIATRHRRRSHSQSRITSLPAGIRCADGFGADENLPRPWLAIARRGRGRCDRSHYSRRCKPGGGWRKRLRQKYARSHGVPADRPNARQCFLRWDRYLGHSSPCFRAQGRA